MSISRNMGEEVNSKAGIMELLVMALPYISYTVTAHMLNESPTALNIPAYFLRLTFDHLWTSVDLYGHSPGPGGPPASMN